MNPDSDFILDLGAPVKSFRVYALEQAISRGLSQELLDVLKERIAKEDDEECKLLLSYAIEAVVNRLKGRDETGAPQEPLDVQVFPRLYEAGDSKVKMELLASVPRELIKPLAPKAVDWLESESHPAIASRLIKIFFRYWPPEKLFILSNKLYSEMVSVRSAALDALMALSPETLVKDLPPLLTSDDPRIRSLAVRGLGKIDPHEALLHLEAMLIGADGSHKIAAIQNCFLMPFELVKPLILKFFSAENDVSFLERLGLLFQSNPDPEIPYRLWEIMEISAKPKGDLIKSILNGVCRSIQKTEILGDGFPKYLEGLQEWINQRMASKFVQETVTRISSADQETYNEIEGCILQQIQRPEIRTAFSEALDWPLSDLVKSRIRNLLSGGLQAESKGEGQPKGDFENLNNEAKMRRIACMKPEEKENGIQILRNIIGNQKSPGDLKATSLRTALRLGIGEFAEPTFFWIEDLDGNLASAALEYQAFFNPQKVKPFIERLVKSSNPRLKVTAIKIWKNFDQPKALSHLVDLLLSGVEENQKIALQCIFYFDFPLIREPLTDFLISEQGWTKTESCLCLYISNPDPENLYCLFKLEKALPTKTSRLAKETRRKCEEILIRYNRISASESAKREEAFEKSYRQEKIKTVAPPPSYAFRPSPSKYVPEKVVIDKKAKDFGDFQEWAEFLLENKFLLLAAVWIGIVLSLWGWIF